MVFDWFSGIDSMLSVFATIAGAVIFCSRNHVTFETSVYPWSDRRRFGVFIGGSGRGRGELSFRALAIGGRLRTIPAASEDECRGFLELRPLQQTAVFTVTLSEKGSVWSEDLLVELDDGLNGALVVLTPAGTTWLRSVLSVRVIRISR